MSKYPYSFLELVENSVLSSFATDLGSQSPYPRTAWQFQSQTRKFRSFTILSIRGNNERHF